MNRIVRPAAALAAVVALTVIVACGDGASTAPDDFARSTQGENTAGTDTGGVKTDTGGVKPDTGGVKPDTGGVKPDTGGVKPDTGGVKPDTGGVKPDTSVKPDTGRTKPDPVHPDTTVDDAYVRGVVMAVDSTVSRPMPAPMANVQVSIFRIRQETPGGDFIHDSVGTQRTGGDGTFEFRNLRGGHYLARAVPPQGSGYATVERLFIAWSDRDLVMRVPLTIYLHKGP